MSYLPCMPRAIRGITSVLQVCWRILLHVIQTPFFIIFIYSVHRIPCWVALWKYTGMSAWLSKGSHKYVAPFGPITPASESKLVLCARMNVPQGLRSLVSDGYLICWTEIITITSVINFHCMPMQGEVQARNEPHCAQIKTCKSKWINATLWKFMITQLQFFFLFCHTDASLGTKWSCHWTRRSASTCTMLYNATFEYSVVLQ